MANGWGGKRPGAGRPRKVRPDLKLVGGSEAPAPSPPPPPPPPKAKPLKGEIVISGTPVLCPPDQSPRDFLLDLMRNPDLPLGFRRDAAALALPYCHPKLAEVGKKAQAEEAARTAERGSGWDGLLN